jgi:hypothetical protein
VVTKKGRRPTQSSPFFWGDGVDVVIDMTQLCSIVDDYQSQTMISVGESDVFMDKVSVVESGNQLLSADVIIERAIQKQCQAPQMLLICGSKGD